jgi:hypothetical protein
MISYKTSEAPTFELAPAGTHKAFIDGVDIYDENPNQLKLIVKFDLVDLDGVTHNEFVVPEIMEGDGFRVFGDLVGLANPNGLPPQGDFDEQILEGLDCMVTIVHREGRGKHAGKTFANVQKVEAMPKEEADKKKQ